MLRDVCEETEMVIAKVRESFKHRHREVVSLYRAPQAHITKLKQRARTHEPCTDHRATSET